MNVCVGCVVLSREVQRLQAIIDEARAELALRDATDGAAMVVGQHLIRTAFGE